MARAAAGSLVFDVGAHVGWFGLLAAARGHTVVAIEPQVTAHSDIP